MSALFCNLSPPLFLTQAAVDILLRKPHAVNKRIVGAVFVKEHSSASEARSEASEALRGLEELNLSSDYLRRARALTRKIIPKDPSDRPQMETVTWDLDRVAFEPRRDQQKSNFFFTAHSFALVRSGSDGDATLALEVDSEMPDSERAIADRLYFRPLVKWCQAEALTPSEPSLKLVDLADYHETYRRLKTKYSKSLVENWTESTDAEKFVHEDLAIAAFLISVWSQDKEEGKGKPSFVDLGCGNGLLVHILSGEGYRGAGIDLRRRKIWDSLEADLRVETIVPSVDTRFPEFDWLLGNHSDELTPWLPLMAALTSHRTKFFVLPCCPFEFTSKFQRKNMKVSLFRDYLNYVKRVGEDCGFVMEEDRLRIPSTKRICFVGRRKTHGDGVERERLLEGLLSTLPLRGKDGDGDGDAPAAKKAKFVPREVDIKVTNCTNVSQEASDAMVEKIVEMCLSTPRPLSERASEDFLSEPASLTWNQGGVVPLPDIARALGPALLSQLKSGCGGLQTFLRNRNYLFVVLKGGVRLRCHATDAHETGRRTAARDKDRAKAGAKREQFRKKKRCWFHDHHPQGCPVASADCFQAHGEEDIAR